MKIAAYGRAMVEGVGEARATVAAEGQPQLHDEDCIWPTPSHSAWERPDDESHVEALAPTVVLEAWDYV